MGIRLEKRVDKNLFIQICNESLSMAEACSKLGFHFNSFKRLAVKWGCYNTNQSGKGITKKSTIGYTLHDILDGKHPQYSTFKLKKRLLKENVLEHKCSECGIVGWNDKVLEMELDHIDGNKYNHELINLRLLCPNCHSQTDTFRGKKRNLDA